MEDWKRRRLSILLFTGITLGWMVLCYIAWVVSGCKPFMPFISDFDLFEPGDTIFTIGLTLTSIVVVWVMIELQLNNRDTLSSLGAHWGWHVVNHAAIFPGMVGAYAAYMLARTPWDADGLMHGKFAFDIFYKGIYWCILVNVVTLRIHWKSSNLRKIILLRATPCIAAIIGLVQMIRNTMLVWTIDFDWDAWNAAPENMMEFCTNNSYPALNVAAAWEFVLCLGIVFTVASFLLDLQPSNDFHSEEE